MASLKERLQDTCICGHTGAQHTATDRGTHIALEGCTAIMDDDGTRVSCGCPQYRRIPKPGERAGKQSLPGHGKYIKSHYRA